MSADMRARAVALAKRGFRVFPLVANGKTPAVETDWRWLASSDPLRVHGMWTDAWDNGTDHNVGIAVDDEFVVIDVDVKDGRKGAESLALLDMIYDPLPATLTVRTASGGQHLYFKTPAPLANTVGKLGANIDTRGRSGFVVAPGSIIGGVEYVVTVAVDMAQIPQWVIDDVGRAPERVNEKSRKTLVDLDQESNIKRAEQWLDRQEDGQATEGAGGDSATYAIAARVIDFGLSVETARDVMLDHWNDRQSPPWDPSDLETKVRNAWNFRQNPVGIADAEVEFDDQTTAETGITGTAKKRGRLPLVPGVVEWDDLEKVPPRQWLYGHKLSRKYTAFVASPGGVGKTAWVTGVALACASGQAVLHDKPHHAMRVWVYNLEDDILEVRRRVFAAVQHHDLPRATLDNLRVNSGRDRGLKVVKLENDELRVEPDAKALIAQMLDQRIELLIIDPFLRSHSVPENDTSAQDEVMRVYADIAEQTNAAILLVHHTRKGAVAGDQEGLRGSSTQGGGARSVFTMSPMAKEDGERLGVREFDRRLYVRLDNAKANMSPPAADVEWIKLASMKLENATPDYPDGDSVQVARKWIPPDPLAGVEPEALEACLASILAGEDGEFFTERRQDDRWAGHVVVEMLKKSEEQAKAILKLWKEQKRVETREYQSPSQRKTRKGLFAPETKETEFGPSPTQ